MAGVGSSIGKGARKDFFVSFNAHDEAWARWITWELRSAGHLVAHQDDWRPGQNWVLEMQRALAQSERVIAVLSPSYLAADFTAAEWAAAFAQDPTGERGTLRPVRVGECSPTGLLSTVLYIDLVGLDEYSARQALLAGVAPPGAPPPTLMPAADQADKPPFPGVRRAIFTALQGPIFEGRDELLAELDAGRRRRAVQVVWGMGGVGKTRLVVEYAFRHRMDYRQICWVKAGGLASLVSEYASLAKELAVPDPDSVDQTRVLAGVREWLSQSPGVLLVLDGVPGPYDEVGDGRPFQKVLDFLPEPGTAHVIVTTRESRWEAQFGPLLEVRPLPPDQAVDFLLRRTRRTIGEDTGAVELAKALGYLPLALEQAGAFISETHISFSDYRMRLRGHPELFGKGKPHDYDDTVATTWQVSIDRVRAEFPGAVDLLEVCAFLASDDIPRWLFSQEGVSGLTPGLREIAENIIRLDEAIATLARHSLILQVYQQSVDVHRLVQEVVRHRLTQEPLEKERRAATALALVESLFPEEIENTETWPLCDRLVPHAEEAAANARALGFVGNAAPRLLDRVAQYLHERARLVKAESMFDEALAFARKVHGPNKRETARILSNSGRAAYDRGDLKKARKRLEESLTIFRRKADRDNTEFASALSNYGLVLRDYGEFANAQANLLEVLEMRKRVYPQRHPEVARALSNFGLILQELGSPVNAREMQEEAHLIFEHKHGPEHRRTQIALRRLAVVLYDLGELDAAQTRLEQVLAFFDRNTYGEDHPEVARTAHHLAQVLWDAGEYERAREQYGRARDIFLRTFGPNHPALGRALTGLGLVMQDQAMLDEAEESLRTALEIFKKAFGRDHPEVARTLDALGFVARHQRRPAEAKQHLARALEILATAFDGREMPEMGIPLTNLGLVLQEDGDLEEAEAHHRRALRIFHACGYPPDHLHIHLTNSRLAIVLQQQGQLEQARDLLEDAERVFKQKYRPNHPDIARVIEKLGLNYAASGRAHDARRRLDEAVQIFMTTFGPSHPRTEISLRRHSAALGGPGP